MKLMKAMYIAIAALGVLTLANCSSGGGSNNAATCYTQNGMTYQSGTVVPTSNCGGGMYTMYGSQCMGSNGQIVGANYCGGNAYGYNNGYYGGVGGIGTGYGYGYGSGYGAGYGSGYTCQYPGQHLVQIGYQMYCSY